MFAPHPTIRRFAARALALSTAACLCIGCAGNGVARDAGSSPAAEATVTVTPVAGASPNGTSVAGATGTSSDDVLTVSPAPQPSLAASSDALIAPQPGPAYGLMLGPSTIDDGVQRGAADSGQAVAKTLSTAADVLSANSAPVLSNDDPPTVIAARELDAKIPASEYDLAELAKTLPSDPVALYRIVTDQVAIDGYDGVMRGPLITWLSRAGGPADKVTLLAWVLLAKGIPYQFVRGTLSPDERARIAQAVATVPNVKPSVDPKVAAYVGARVKQGATFAGWARDLLKSKNVATANLPPPADRMSPRHYWIQIERGGKLLDLDPTLSGTTAGTHLGTSDPSFTPSAILPGAEWHELQVRVVATYDDNTRKTLLGHTDSVPNLAQTPIRVIFARAGKDADLADPGKATTFDGGIEIGVGPAGSAHVDLAAVNPALRAISVEVRRKDADGKTLPVARRALFDANVAPADRPYRLAGMTTIIVMPGRGANAFTVHEQLRSLAQLAQDVADAKAGKTPAPHPWYPLRIADYFMRDDAVADALSASTGARLYRDRPNVVMQRTAFVRGTAAGPAAADVTFDIADNGMGSMTANAAVGVAANLARGYADTQIEHDVAERSSPNGTIALFATAGVQNAANVLTQASAADAADPLRAGLDQTFAVGQVAIAPPGSVALAGRPSFGWWAIDPASGNSVGRMSGGAGQDMAEYTVVNTASKALTLYGQLQTAQTCITSGFGSVGCIVSACGSIAGLLFGGASLPEFASNVVIGGAPGLGSGLAGAGCSSTFGGG